MNEAELLKVEREGRAITWFDLRPRERQILYMMAVHGKTRVQIAKELNITASAVASNVSGALRILDCENVTQAAFRMGQWAEDVLK